VREREDNTGAGKKRDAGNQADMSVKETGNTEQGENGD
jgi:hypothetical protein